MVSKLRRISAGGKPFIDRSQSATRGDSAPRRDDESRSLHAPTNARIPASSSLRRMGNDSPGDPISHPPISTCTPHSVRRPMVDATALGSGTAEELPSCHGRRPCPLTGFGGSREVKFEPERASERRPRYRHRSCHRGAPRTSSQGTDQGPCLRSDRECSDLLARSFRIFFLAPYR